MNCQDILLLLDDADPAGLDAATRDRIDAHLAHCNDCARAWQAQAALASLAAPAVPRELAARCRRIAHAQPPVVTRRRAARPLLVGAVLLAGAAAAYVALRPADNGPATADTGIALQSGQGRVSAAGNAADPGAAAAPAAAAPAVDASEPAGTDGAFTVAVSPLRQAATETDVMRATEAVYAALLDRLRALPNLELIELTEEEMTALGRPAQPVAGAITGNGLIGNTVRLESGVEVRQTEQQAATGTTRINLVAFGDTDSVEFNQVPTALSSRIEAVTSGAAAGGNDPVGQSALDGVVNVIMSNNIQGITVAMNAASFDDAPAEPLPYDVLMAIGGSGSDGLWRLQLVGETGDRSRMGYSIGGPADSSFEQMLDTLMVQLRESLLPPDATLIAELELEFSDPARTPQERLRVLERLLRILERTDSAALSGASIRAAAGLAAGASDPRQRARVWNALRNAADERLLQPLTDSLFNDPDEQVRLEAALALAAYEDNDVARSALASAGSSEAADAVRQTARWASLDDVGRRTLMLSTLLDSTLLPEDRLAVLDLPVFPGVTGPGIPGIAGLIDGDVADTLNNLIVQIESPRQRAQLLGRLGALEAPALTRILMLHLRDDPDPQVRLVAATNLFRHSDEPDVRQALEFAAAADAAESVREAAQFALEGPPSG